MDEYPIWYFFYGTLADTRKLGRVIGRPVDQDKLRDAELRSGRVGMWKGKYKAMVDGDGVMQRQSIAGKAFSVATRQEEDELRVYETDAYEVARCEIWVDDNVQLGLTFRFVGVLDREVSQDGPRVSPDETPVRICFGMFCRTCNRLQSGRYAE